MPISTGQKISEIYAFIAVDDEGDEGICSVHHRNEGWVPLVTQNREDLDKLRPVAADVALRTGHVVHLRRYKVMEIVEVIHPNGYGGSPRQHDGSSQ